MSSKLTKALIAGAIAGVAVALVRRRFADHVERLPQDSAPPPSPPARPEPPTVAKPAPPAAKPAEVTEPPPADPPSPPALEASENGAAPDEIEPAGLDLDGATREQLYRAAQERGVHGRSKMTKAQLRAALEG